MTVWAGELPFGPQTLVQVAPCTPGEPWGQACGGLRGVEGLCTS